MPTFLNWSTALWAAAGAIPVLLLLYFLKLRRKEVDVSSTLLWKKTIHDLQVNAPFQRLRRNLLLLLQLLILLALLLALSRPVARFTPGAGKISVILIDRSASMTAADMDKDTRLNRARKLAKELVDTMEKDSSAMVMAFDDSPDIVQTFTSDRNLLKKAIDSIRPTNRRSRLKMAYQLAEAKAMAFHPDQKLPTSAKPEVWLYSDGRVLDRDEIALHRADLKYVKIGSESAANVAVVAFSAKRNYEQPTQVEAFLRIGNFSPQPARVAVQLTVDGQIPPDGVRNDIALGPSNKQDSQRGLSFKLELNKGAVLRAKIIQSGDDVLPVDDSAEIVLPPPKSLSILLVRPDRNMPLENVLAAAKLKNPGIITPAEYEKKMADPQSVAAAFDVIIFDRYRPRKLPPAGNFIYIFSYPPDSKLRAAQLSGVDQVIKDEKALDWDRSNPLLRGLSLRFQADEALKLQTPIDAQVLVDGLQGPLVVLYREARATHLVVAFDILQSNWPILWDFPVFFDSALSYLALGADMEERQSYQPGTTVKIPRYNIQQAGADVKQIRIDGPDAFGTTTVDVPETGDLALPPLDYIGLYSLKPAIPQYEKLAVSLLDENESTLAPLDEQPGGTGTALKASLGTSRVELWWWIVACAAIPLCLVEWWVYTRRVHL